MAVCEVMHAILELQELFYDFGSLKMWFFRLQEARPHHAYCNLPMTPPPPPGPDPQLQNMLRDASNVSATASEA